MFYGFYGNSSYLIGYILVGIGVLVMAMAQAKVSGAYNKYSRVYNSKGMTGREVAYEILMQNGLGHVQIHEVKGHLSDHYNPGNHTLNLSSEIYHGRSVAALAVAAHECGHALQHKEGYKPLVMRNAIVPVCNFSQYVGWIAIVAGLLLKQNKTISIAESCTGGLMAHKLTNISGISRCFEGGIVSYSNRLKCELLKVNVDTIEKYGAVSWQTAAKMAKGIRMATGTDIGISITGIAGPDGGTPEKPVGLVYIGYSDLNSEHIEQCYFFGDRQDIKRRSVNSAFHLLRKMLNPR